MRYKIGLDAGPKPQGSGAHSSACKSQELFSPSQLLLNFAPF